MVLKIYCSDDDRFQIPTSGQIHVNKRCYTVTGRDTNTLSQRSTLVYQASC